METEEIFDNAKKNIRSRIEKVQIEGFKSLEKLSNEDVPFNAEVLYLLGRCYYYGIGVEKDLKLAEDCFRDAADEEYAEAQLMLGKIYASSMNNRLIKKSKRLIKSAAEQKNPEAMYLYALSILKNDLCSKEAREFLEEAADRNQPQANTCLGLIETKNGNYVDAFKYYNQSASKDSIAERLLADRYLYEDIPQKEIEELKEHYTDEEYRYRIYLRAYNLYKDAAAKGDLEAKFRCAIFERDGIYKDDSPNMKKAICSLFEAAEVSYMPAIKCLNKIKDGKGKIWEKYFGTKGEKRLKWFEEKAEFKEADGLYMLGEYDKAYNSYLHNTGNSYAKFRQAHCLFFGKGIKMDRKMAVQILEQDIISNPIKSYNPLAYYLLSYYYLCIRINEIVHGDTKLKDKETYEVIEKGKKFYQYAQQKTCLLFDNSKNFHDELGNYFDVAELDYIIADMKLQAIEDEEVGISLQAITEEIRKQKLLNFLQQIRSRMNYNLISQNLFGKYAKGDRELSKENNVCYIALEAGLSLEECKNLYSLAKFSFDPVMYLDHKALADVLTGEYRKELNRDELEMIDNELRCKNDTAYDLLYKKYQNRKLLKYR